MKIDNIEVDFNAIHNDKFCHIKTGKIYRFIRMAINSTNENDGQKMVLYTRGGLFFVRELEEFKQKFVKIIDEEGNSKR